MKILIADDHELYRDALTLLISQHFTDCLCTQASSFDALLDRADGESKWTAFLVDLNMPGLNYAEGITTLKSRYPDVPVIVITSSDDPDDTHKALQAGALGYILKSMNNQQITSSLELILNNGISIHPDLNVKKPELKNNSPHNDGQGHLTARQLEVLQRMSLGASNKRIALDMGLSESTIKIHVRAILQYFNVDNRTEAVVKAKSWFE